MAPTKKLSSKSNCVDLDVTINKSALVLTWNSEELNNLEITLGDQVITFKRLNSTIGRKSGMRTTTLSPQLKRMIHEFVENYINPRFYDVPLHTVIGRNSKIPRFSLPGLTR